LGGFTFFLAIRANGREPLLCGISGLKKGRGKTILTEQRAIFEGSKSLTEGTYVLMVLHEVIELGEAEKPCSSKVSAGIHRLEPEPAPNLVFKITFS